MRRNLRIFIFLFIFFIVVAVGSLVVLNGHGSVFNRTRDSIGAQTAVMTQTVIGEENVAEEEPEPEPEPEPQEVTEPVAEVEAEPAEEVVAEPEEETEVEPEQEVEAEPVEEDSSIRYYTYKINTSVHSLRLRQDPDKDSRILVYMTKGSTGYVLKRGESWTKVHTDKGLEGYCSTEYLDLTEVSREDFPEELRDLVEEDDSLKDAGDASLDDDSDVSGDSQITEDAQISDEETVDSQEDAEASQEDAEASQIPVMETSQEQVPENDEASADEG